MSMAALMDAARCPWCLHYYKTIVPLPCECDCHMEQEPYSTVQDHENGSTT